MEWCCEQKGTFWVPLSQRALATQSWSVPQPAPIAWVQRGWQVRLPLPWLVQTKAPWHCCVVLQAAPEVKRVTQVEVIGSQKSVGWQRMLVQLPPVEVTEQVGEVPLQV